MERDYFPNFTDALASSEAGASLKETFRWTTQFRTTETDETWINVFGATGQVFSHSVLFYHLSQYFLEKEKGRFTEEQEEIFLYGVGPHDTGEAKINGKGVGDVSAILKTQSDEKKESQMAKKVIAGLKLPEELRIKLLHGYNQVINGKDPDLHQFFKAIEKSEYVITAMKVYQNNRRLESQGRPRLDPYMEKALVGRVLVIDLAKVLDVYAPVYPNSIGAFFRNSEALIDTMLEFSMPFLSENKFWMGKDVNHQELADAFVKKWEAFKSK